jgi:hypothetical protein
MQNWFLGLSSSSVLFASSQYNHLPHAVPPVGRIAVADDVGAPDAGRQPELEAPAGERVAQARTAAAVHGFVGDFPPSHYVVDAVVDGRRHAFAARVEDSLAYASGDESSGAKRL